MPASSHRETDTGFPLGPGAGEETEADLQDKVLSSARLVENVTFGVLRCDTLGFILKRRCVKVLLQDTHPTLARC